MAAGEITALKAASLHLLCSLSLLVGHWLAWNLYSWNLVTHTSDTLALSLIVHGPIVIGVYGLVRRDQQHCSYFRAVARGLLGLPAGALVMAFGAIVLGAPVGIRYLIGTVYWSLLMSLFTFVPPACAFGSSRMDWHRILAQFKPEESLDALVSLPAYGSVIGAWFGAWPMPLDWERPWQVCIWLYGWKSANWEVCSANDQEWPICVTYGAVAGYLIGAVVSFVFVLIHGPVHAKED